MNFETKYYKFRKKLTTDRNYIDEEEYNKQLEKKELEIEKEVDEEVKNEEVENEEIDDEQELLDTLIEEVDENISKYKIKQWIRDNKETINSLSYDNKEKFLLFIKEKFY